MIFPSQNTTHENSNSSLTQNYHFAPQNRQISIFHILQKLGMLQQFTPTSGAGGSTHLESTPMTYEQYLDLKNEYRTMVEELKRYNEFKASQQGLTPSKQYS